MRHIMWQKHGYNPKDQMEKPQTRSTDTWIHLDSLESGEKSDDSRDDDIQSWVSWRSDDEREFEEPEMYETKSYCASSQRLDCGRQNNSKWPLIGYYR